MHPFAQISGWSGLVIHADRYEGPQLPFWRREERSMRIRRSRGRVNFDSRREVGGLLVRLLVRLGWD